MIDAEPLLQRMACPDCHSTVTAGPGGVVVQHQDGCPAHASLRRAGGDDDGVDEQSAVRMLLATLDGDHQALAEVVDTAGRWRLALGLCSLALELGMLHTDDDPVALRALLVRRDQGEQA
ncbi:hypothetical protein [Solwaraspora sp. WMMD792]|uniref:hypothetical protein n=1 Tax=Solwaraspora sp. WMMD792 TaxID=3016099 RepID=UPI0024166E8E|nr:hypothetical protein [Solwaraspora sp. WMMD792]MDG4770682.1 hypothetical protein [Solwaraspora sp. WMMD792]